MVRPSGMPFTSPGDASVMSLGAEWPGSASASQSPVCGLQPHAQAWSSLAVQICCIRPQTSRALRQLPGSQEQAILCRQQWEWTGQCRCLSRRHTHTDPDWTSNAFAVGVGDKGGQMDAYAGLGNQAAFVGNPAARGGNRPMHQRTRLVSAIRVADESNRALYSSRTFGIGQMSRGLVALIRTCAEAWDCKCE